MNAIWKSITLPKVIKKIPEWRGLNISKIVLDDIRSDRFSFSITQAVLTYYSFKRYQEQGLLIRGVIDWFENQVIDRSLILGVKHFYSNVYIKGYMGFVVSENFAATAPMDYEYNGNVLPHEILVMGDALAVALMSINDFNDVNFASFHPGGNLGKRLLTIVDMVMTKHNLPICDKKSSIKDVINKITSGKCGLVVVTEKNMMLGVITDGDIRRFMTIHEKDFFALRALDLMTGMPKTIGPNENIIIANDMMNKWKINSLVVLDDLGRVIGILQKHDLDKNTV